MLILCDSKMPSAAKVKLATYGEIIDFATEGITYDAISGHPDIFFCPTPAGLIVAPNLPEKYIALLEQHGIYFSKGELPVGNKYPESARYNSLATDSFLVRNLSLSDLAIQKMNAGLETIPVNQGYTRCNLLALPNDTFITSDRGMEKSLKIKNVEVLFVNPANVKLNGFDHGFFGGACGISGNTLFLCGSLSWFKEEKLIRKFTEHAGLRIIELFDGQPVDVGTILFLQ